MLLFTHVARHSQGLLVGLEDVRLVQLKDDAVVPPVVVGIHVVDRKAIVHQSLIAFVELVGDARVEIVVHGVAQLLLPQLLLGSRRSHGAHS